MTLKTQEKGLTVGDLVCEPSIYGEHREYGVIVSPKEYAASIYVDGTIEEFADRLIMGIVKVCVKTPRGYTLFSSDRLYKVEDVSAEITRIRQRTEEKLAYIRRESENEIAFLQDVMSRQQ